MARLNRSSRILVAALGLAAGLVGVAASAISDVESRPTLPYAAAGLSDRQAAAHLLDRFAYGPRPGDVDRLVAQGLEAWLEAQLQGTTIADPRFAEKIRPLDAWGMSAGELARTFPPYLVLRREAMEAGLVDRSMVPPQPGDPAGKGRMADDRRAMLELYRERGYRSQGELIGQLMAHRLLAAVYSENQLQAVLVDFWFNHFNVSLTDNQARGHLLSFERDAVVPGVLGRFDQLLAAVAAHPAMLLYLDNAQSTAKEGVATTIDRRLQDGQARGMRGGSPSGPPGGARGGGQRPVPNRPRGLNENYARELLELHTLGVDGGYTQDDVIAVARAFTGWAVLPPGAFGDETRERLRRAGRGGRFGFVAHDDGFVFRADAHDAEPKTVLGRKLPGGRGIEDGQDVLALLAYHPSTARHLARKLATRFVADEPPPALVDRLARIFLESGGDLRQVMRALAYSPEFWSGEARGAKIKSPFELAVSAVRALGGEVAVPPPAGAMVAEGRRAPGSNGLLDWIGRMGQPLYAYQAPTGFPDRAEAWVSTGSLLTRMNFGLHLASGRVSGVSLDLAGLNGNREPESPEQALATYAALVLPERDLTGTLRRLQPMVRDPELGGRLELAAAEVPQAAPDPRSADEMEWVEAAAVADAPGANPAADQSAAGRPPDAVEQVVGLILGSPEFQRR